MSESRQAGSVPGRLGGATPAHETRTPAGYETTTPPGHPTVPVPGLTYRDAGVDIDAGNEAVRRIGSHARRTFRPGVLGDIGGFGGLFGLDLRKYPDPVLVSGTDGVGTKLKVAIMIGKHDSIGIDVVAMCANDVAVQGAEPLFFLDYLAVGNLNPVMVEEIVRGVADGCLQAGCALIGGETAEMPDLYAPGEYDIAGFCVGAANRAELIDGSKIRPGDGVIGLASTGLHSNGFSLVRKVFLGVAGWRPDRMVPELGSTLGEELLKPTRIYVRTVLNLKERFELRGIAHITGGGLVENIPRVLPSGTRVRLRWGSWPVLPIFQLIAGLGGVPIEDMRRTFNLGLGMILIVPAEQAGAVMEEAQRLGEKPYLVGEVVAGEPGVDIV